MRHLTNPEPSLPISANTRPLMLAMVVPLAATCAIGLPGLSPQASARGTATSLRLYVPEKSSRVDQLEVILKQGSPERLSWHHAGPHDQPSSCARAGSQPSPFALPVEWQPVVSDQGAFSRQACLLSSMTFRGPPVRV